LDCPDESLQSTSDAEGRCVFNLPFTTEEPAVLEVTRFEDARNVRTKFVVANLLDRTPGREAELEVPDAALEVRVHDGRGAPVAAAVKIEPVSYWNEGSEVAGTLTFTLAAARDTDSNGIARFAGLVPGKFKVWTTSSDGSMIPPVSVDVVAGVPGRIDVEQPPTGSLTVHVVDAQARSVRRARVDVMRKSDSVVIASFRLTDETGTATFPAIAAGDVTVSAGNDLRDLSATGYGKADGHVESGTGSTITIKMD
jgi:hypothetical protein